MGRKRIDYTGYKFNRLTVLRYDQEASLNNSKRCSMYVCKCDCGNVTHPISITDLKRGHTKSCGCLLKEQVKNNSSKIAKLDMIGKKFGKLTVTRKYTDQNSKVIKWYCNCDCGKKDYIVEGTSLRAGRVKSCGCLIRESAHNGYKDITGNKYGILTAIKPIDEDYKNRKTGMKWLTKCDCGCTKIVKLNSLESGVTISCGCITSKNEFYIRQILLENNICFETQYMFDNCRNPNTNHRLKFDFAIFDEQHNLSFLIEYDGEQHELGMRYSKSKKKNEEKFEQLKYRDQIKNQYCNDNHISLYRISYKDKDNIKNIINNILIKEDIINGIYKTNC